MVLIFAEEISERLQYTLDFIFSERNIVFQLTNDEQFFENTPLVKFNYSNLVFENCASFKPATLVFDEKIEKYEITKSQFGKEECIAFNGITDPLASIFYVLSRMEEYAEVNRDSHDRFPAKASILYRFNWLQKAMCDRWSEAILDFIEESTSIQLNLKKTVTSIIPTFDIDNTFAFKWKSGARMWLSIIRDWINRDRIRIETRKAVRSGTEEDPFDTFSYMLDIKKRGFDVHIFWLLGDYAKYDRNISSLDLRHQKLIQEMANQVELGLHPSYKSNSSNVFLAKEKQKINSILKREVSISRQHFLKLNIPNTYINLMKHGFSEDFTMGYAEEIGFRAGTAKPFRFFDLSKNILTDYLIHPFVYMDGTLHEYKHWNIEESKIQIKKLYDEVNRFGGDFTFIWHNETIADYRKWRGWNEVLEYTLSLRDGH